MDKTSDIVCRRFVNQYGNIERIEYSWKGKSQKIYLSFREGLFAGKGIGDVFSIGPYRLRIIEFDYSTSQALCVRVDLLFGWWFVFAHRAGRMLDLFYRRLIITASVWGLADYDRCTIPSWRNLHIVKWLIKLCH
jgi:hypothetical protein